MKWISWIAIFAICFLFGRLIGKMLKKKLKEQGENKQEFKKQEIKKRNPGPEAERLIKRQIELQRNFLNRGDYCLAKDIEFPDGCWAVYYVVHEVQFKELKEVNVKEVTARGEKLKLFEPKEKNIVDLENDLYDWEIELVEQLIKTSSNKFISQYYLMVDCCGRVCWFWNDYGISSYYSDELTNEILIRGCQILEETRKLANN